MKFAAYMETGAMVRPFSVQFFGLNSAGSNS
jgi:hypothetical protein